MKIFNRINEQRVKRRTNRKRAFAQAALTLTSLVDCFTIIVVYLLVTTNFGAEPMAVPKGLQLPKANHSDVLNAGLIVQVRDGKIYVADKIVRMDQLSNVLKLQKGKFQSMLIQADQKTKYFDLNPVVLSGLSAGFSDIKFAVLQEDQV